MRDKASAKAKELKGRAKEAIGEDTQRPGLAREGRTEQRVGNLRLAGQKLKEAFTRKGGAR